MPVTFAPMNCRLCGTAIIPIEPSMAENRTTQSYGDCNYVCEPCGVGYSNSQSEGSRTMIYASYLDNLPCGPDGLRTDLDNCLQNAVNVRNRDNKRNKFAFATSEDAITWSMFWFLKHTKQLAYALGGESSTNATLLLWGCPVYEDPSELTTKLHEIQVDELGENSSSKSEPDVIVETDTRLFFVESKYGSSNSCKPGYHHWGTYLQTENPLFFSTSKHQIIKAGLEELTRNWVIGNMLANRIGKRFELVNLGPNAIQASSNQFAELVDQNVADYRFLSWSTLIDRIKTEDWFEAYLRSKNLS